MKKVASEGDNIYFFGLHSLHNFNEFVRAKTVKPFFSRSQNTAPAGNAKLKATNKKFESVDVQPKLTSFFPIRRSERRPKHESEAAMQKLIEDRLIVDNDKGLDLEIRDIPGKVIWGKDNFFF